MARTTAEIKKQMTDAFMADETLREKYGLEQDATWNDSFSSVSFENILLFIVAACCHVLELLMDQYLKDVNDKIASAVVASVPWYYKKALEFQWGDPLVLNETTLQYEYEKTDESKQVVKYAAVRDKGTCVQILVSGESNGSPAALSNDVLTVFKQYMNRVKVAGVVLNINSRNSDHLQLFATITIDPLVLNTQGELHNDGTKPVESAIADYLKNIVYGGTFNKTRLVDAIQNAEGVLDVELGECMYMADGEESYTTISGNNYVGVSGSYVADELANSLVYVVQN